jgi:hypothetical protein
MNISYKSVVAILLAFVLCFACSKNPAAPDYQKEVSVFGYLWGNQALSEKYAVSISYSQSITSFYDFQKAAISGAEVTIIEAGTENVYELTESSTQKGNYYNEQLLVKPKTTYRLSIKTDGKTITATTRVPDDLKITTELKMDSANEVHQTNLGFDKPVYLESDSLEQIILVDVFCNEQYEKAEYLYPFHDDHKFPDDQNEYDGGISGEPRHIQALVPYKELVSEKFDGQNVVYWYASMIVFKGSNTMQVLAIDDNYHNFIMSEHPVYSSGIVGGIGVFGSVVGEKYELMVVGK